MNAGRMKLHSIFEEAAFRISSYMAENSLCDTEILLDQSSSE